MKKLIYITTRLFWPTDSGRKISLYHFCKGLHESYGYDIYIYSFLEAGQDESLLASKPDFIKEVKIARKVSKNEKILNLFFKAGFRRWPFQSCLFFSKSNKKHIRDFCDRVKPDAIMVDMIRLAPYWSVIKDLECKKILDLDDMLSKRYARQAENLSGKTSIFGTFSEKKSLGENLLSKSKFLKKIVLKSEARRIRRAEEKYGERFDFVKFVSSIETNDYNSKYSKKNAVTSSLGVDFDYFSEPFVVEKIPNSIAFVGNLKYSPNIDSLKIIIEQILPRLKTDYKFYVIGGGENDIKDKYSSDRIIFLGRVDDFRPVVKSCSVFLAPIAYGSGIKTKILEAMAMGAPIVTNSLGAEGLSLCDGKEMAIKDNYEEIADATSELLINPEKGQNMAVYSQEYVKKYHNWPVIYKTYIQMGF